MKFVLILVYFALAPAGDSTTELPHSMTAAEFNSEEACKQAGETVRKGTEAFKLTHTVFFVCVPKGPERWKP